MTEGERIDRTLAALANPVRRAMLDRLLLGPASVSELGEPFAISQPAVSRHIRVLEEAGLLVQGRDGQRRPCRLEAGPLGDLVDWLDPFRRHWEGRFRRIDRLIDKLQALERKLGSGNE